MQFTWPCHCLHQPKSTERKIRRHFVLPRSISLNVDFINNAIHKASISQRPYNEKFGDILSCQDQFHLTSISSTMQFKGLHQPKAIERKIRRHFVLPRSISLNVDFINNAIHKALPLSPSAKIHRTKNSETFCLAKINVT